MEFDLSKIKMNNHALKRGITLPKRLTEGLAELIGIIAGDGHLGFFPKKDCSDKFDLNISGNKSEKDYLLYINDLFHSLFNINLRYQQESNSNAIMLRTQYKAIVEFLNKICRIPLNKKTNTVKVPKIIMSGNNQIKCAFLRGLADTDFSLCFQNRTGKGHNYPVIKGCFKSRGLIKDLEILFPKLGLKHCVYYDNIRYDKRFGPLIMHNIYLYGKKNLKVWLNKIGFSNPKYHRKINKWKKDGICPPGY